MKTSQHMTLQLPKVRTRAHVILFCANTPFKPQKVKNKKAFQRQPKHVACLFAQD